MSLRPVQSLAPAYFIEKYETDPDPWKFASSAYEQEKYAASLGALSKNYYANALEVGCSIGVFTRQLARRCGRLLAIDAALPALVQAQRRCEDLPNIAFGEACVPGDWPDGSFDLIVFSEVIYYLNEADLKTLVACAERSAARDAAILLVHWTGLTDYPLSGDEASEIFIRQSCHFAKVTLQDRTTNYRLDRLECRH
jgi:SAM-dependent methyltransferase